MAVCSAGDSPHLYVLVVVGDRYKLRQPLAEPHGDVPVHVDSKRFVAFLQATDGEVLQSADVFTKVHSPHLTYTQTAHWNKTWTWTEETLSNFLCIVTCTQHLMDHLCY